MTKGIDNLVNKYKLDKHVGEGLVEKSSSRTKRELCLVMLGCCALKIADL